MLKCNTITLSIDFNYFNCYFIFEFKKLVSSPLKKFIYGHHHIIPMNNDHQHLIHMCNRNWLDSRCRNESTSDSRTGNESSPDSHDERHPLKKTIFKLFFGLQQYKGSFPNTPLSVSRRKKLKSSQKVMYFPMRETTFSIPIF